MFFPFFLSRKNVLFRYFLHSFRPSSGRAGQSFQDFFVRLFYVSFITKSTAIEQKRQVNKKKAWLRIKDFFKKKKKANDDKTNIVANM